MQNSSQNLKVSLGSLKHLVSHLSRQSARAELSKALMAQMGQLPRKQARAAARLMARFATLDQNSPPEALAKLNRDLGRFFGER